MKPFRFSIATFLSLSLLLSSPACSQAAEADLEKPDLAETIEEVSRFTGLSKDVVSLVHEQHAEFFKGVDNTVFAYRVFNMIVDANDTKALTEVTMRALEVVKDLVAEQAFPAVVNNFFTVASTFKASLELIRDYVFIPRVKESLYANYRKFRTNDPSEEAMENAFQLATTAWFSGYNTVKASMIDEMIKKRGWNKEHVSQKLEDQVDKFWMRELELRLQQERLKAKKEEIRKEIWARSAAQLEAIKAAAGKATSGGMASFFIRVPQDLPAGWWLWSIAAQGGDGAPRRNQGASSEVWNQAFWCSRDQGCVRDHSGNWVDPKKKRSCSHIDVRVSIHDDSAIGAHLLNTYIANSLVQFMKDDSSARQMNEIKNAAISFKYSNDIRIMFFKGVYRVVIQLSGMAGENSLPTEAMAIGFAKNIESRIKIAKK